MSWLKRFTPPPDWRRPLGIAETTWLVWTVLACITLAALAMLMLSGCGEFGHPPPAPGPTWTPSPSPTASATAGPSPTPSETPLPSPTPYVYPFEWDQISEVGTGELCITAQHADGTPVEGATVTAAEYPVNLTPSPQGTLVSIVTAGRPAVCWELVGGYVVEAWAPFGEEDAVHGPLVFVEVGELERLTVVFIERQTNR